MKKAIVLLLCVPILLLSCKKEIHTKEEITLIEGAMFEKISVENPRPVFYEGEEKIAFDIVFYGQGVGLKEIVLEFVHEDDDDIEDIIESVELVKSGSENDIHISHLSIDEEEYQINYTPYINGHTIEYGDRYQLLISTMDDFPETAKVKVFMAIALSGVFGETQVFRDYEIEGHLRKMDFEKQ